MSESESESKELDLASQVRTQMLKLARPALRRLNRASRGRSDFRSEIELRACLGLARVAASLLRQPRESSIEHDNKLIRRMIKGRI